MEKSKSFYKGVVHIVHRVIHKKNQKIPCDNKVTGEKYGNVPQVDIILQKSIWFTEQQLKVRKNREDSVLFSGYICPRRVGIHLQNRAIKQLTFQVELLAFLCLGKITDRHFLQGMLPVELAGEQIVHPV